MNRLKEKTFERIGVYCNFPNIINANTLDVYQNYISKFDLIIGNPPYVRIHNMDSETKNEFSFSKKGMTDLYLIFYLLLQTIPKLYFEPTFPFYYTYTIN